MADLLSIGDTSIDTFLILDHDEADIKCDLRDNGCKVCLDLSEKIPVKELHHTIGGNACNIAVGLARLGVDTAINTTVGKDENGKKIIFQLEKEGVGIDQVQQQGATNSSIALIYKGYRTLLVHHEEREYQFSEGAKWVLLTSMAPGSEAIHQQIVNYVQNNNSKLVFSPGTYQRRAGANKYKDILELCDIITMNLEEAQDYTESGKADIKDLLNKLIEFGPEIAVITDGEKGAYAFDGSTFYKSDVIPTKVVEPTGAGDAFTSGFVAAIIAGHDIPQALTWGSINSSSAIEEIGPQKGLLSLPALRHRAEGLDLVKNLDN